MNECKVYLQVTICCDSQEKAIRAQEAVGRMAVGLALDEIVVAIVVGGVDPDQAEDER